MTREEIQTRLDEIGEKYGETIILGPETNTEKVTENFFTRVEAMCENNNYNIPTESTVELLDDEQIDKITIPEIGTYAAPGESYSGTITNNHMITYNVNVLSYTDYVDVLIKWQTTTTALSKCKVEASIGNCVSNLDPNIQYSISEFEYMFSSLVNLANPSFSYSYTLKANRNGTEIFSKNYFGLHN